MARLNKTWQVGDANAALAAELHRELGVSHRQAKGIIDAGCVRLNGEVVHSHGLRPKAGETLAVSYDPDQAYQELPPLKTQIAEAGFKILWEDKHLVFVDKPAGLLTVPSESGREDCLAEAITEHYQRRGFKRFQLYIVHRLDRFSSGVLVFAKTPEALHGLKKLFESHHLNRVYKAILVGEIPENAGTLTGKLVEHTKSLKMSVVQPRKHEPKGAKLAITHFRVLERLPGHTVVEVRLETGRRNQIRVQFADRGYPLLGDQVYGEESPLLDRQALHAEILGFRHPVTDESLTVSTPMPADMERALKALRNLRRVERAEAGVVGEEGIYKPKITKARKFERVRRAERFDERPERQDERKGFREARGRDLDREEAPRDFKSRKAFGPGRSGKPGKDDAREPGAGNRPAGRFGRRPEGRPFGRDEKRSESHAEGRREYRREGRPEDARDERSGRPVGRSGDERPRRPAGARPASPRSEDRTTRRRDEDGARPQHARSPRPEYRKDQGEDRRPGRPVRERAQAGSRTEAGPRSESRSRGERPASPRSAAPQRDAKPGFKPASRPRSGAGATSGAKSNAKSSARPTSRSPRKLK